MRRLAALLVVLAGLAAGCGEDGDGAAGGGTVDSTEIEQQIKTQLSGPTVQISSVSCPDDVPKKKGDTFDCTTKIEGGGSGTVVVTQVNGVNRYTYTFKSGTLKIPGSSVEPVIQQSLEAEGLDVTSVNCPDTIIVKADTTVTCTAATASGATVDTTFTLTSSGEVDPSSVESE